MHWKIYECGRRGHEDTAAIKEGPARPLERPFHPAERAARSPPVNVHLTLTY